MRIKTAIRAAFRKLGLDVHRYSPPVFPVSPLSPIISSLHRFGIDLVLDVGANRGQFASEIRRGGYTGNIVSFEPLSEPHGDLLRASHDDKNWEVYPRCALGDQNGEVEINIAGNSLSSSILPMLDAHRDAAPESVYMGKETAPIKMLDTIARPHLKKSRAPFLKIDAQGFEWQVLDGAHSLLPQIRGALLELSLVPLYDGQHLWVETIERLETAGFELWAFKPVFSDPRDGRTLQVDAIFFRNP